LLELIEYLYQFYPRTHLVSLVRSTGCADHPAIISSTELFQLREAIAEELSGASLFIPATLTSNPEKQFLERMENS
jgi:hypothetical protein